MAKLRAPARHGDLLLEPATGLTALVRSNETALNAATLWGRSLSEWRLTARAEVLALSDQYTSSLFETTAPNHLNDRSDSTPWLIGGHQPELFHPGVWAKNAVLHELAHQVGGVALNLTVDNDLCTEAAVSVPRERDHGGLTSIEWDHPHPQSPWEERPQPDQSLFASFGARCQGHLRSWGIDPLAATQDWSGFPERSLVDRLIHLRGQVERQSGIANQELRVSALSDTDCFQQFVAQLVEHAVEFSSLYNAARQQYCQQHHIRSQSHPVPALSSDARGIELPLWVWRTGETRRSPLYVRQGTLHDGHREIGPLATARQNGWKIRPRALSLTLFCRLLLGSAFIHGIGGALYDQITDTIVSKLIETSPPAIIVATATMRLLESFAGPNPQTHIEQLQHDRRALRWNPELLVERFAAAEKHNESQILELIARKRLVVDEINGVPRTNDPNELRIRHAHAVWQHAEIQSLNHQLLMSLPEDLGTVLDSQLSTWHKQVPHWNSLRSREYASNLFPASQIRELFRDLQQRVAANC